MSPSKRLLLHVSLILVGLALVVGSSTNLDSREHVISLDAVNDTNNIELNGAMSRDRNFNDVMQPRFQARELRSRDGIGRPEENSTQGQTTWKGGTDATRNGDEYTEKEERRMEEDIQQQKPSYIKKRNRGEPLVPRAKLEKKPQSDNKLIAKKLHNPDDISGGGDFNIASTNRNSYIKPGSLPVPSTSTTLASSNGSAVPDDGWSTQQGDVVEDKTQTSVQALSPDEEASVEAPKPYTEAAAASSKVSSDGKTSTKRQFDPQEETESGSASKIRLGGSGIPPIERRLFPKSVEIKAHSENRLEEYDQEIFETLQSMLTPYFQAVVGSSLQAYKLEVDYSGGPDVSSVGVYITNMEISVVLDVQSQSLSDYQISHDDVSAYLSTFFEGKQLYQLLGKLRTNGVNVNEIVHFEEEFRSPIFDGSVAAVSTNGSSNGDPSGSDTSKAGLYAAIGVGMIVAAAVMFAHYRGRVLPDRFRLKLHNSLNAVRGSLSNVSEGIKNSFSRSSSQSGSDSEKSNGSSSNPPPAKRGRTWSDTFRRNPPSGIKPAAIQKSPAYSRDYLKSPVASEFSFSVAGDYNIPDEYSLHKSPLSDFSSGMAPHMHQAKPYEDEFSMPEDYNTVNEDMSLYSRSISVQARGGRPQVQRHHSRDVLKSPPGSVRQKKSESV